MQHRARRLSTVSLQLGAATELASGAATNFAPYVRRDCADVLSKAMPPGAAPLSRHPHLQRRTASETDALPLHHDPPYPGLALRYYGCAEVDHVGS